MGGMVMVIMITIMMRSIVVTVVMMVIVRPTGSTQLPMGLHKSSFILWGYALCSLHETRHE